MYTPAIFHVGDVEAAKKIILTPVADMTTGERWEVETRNIVEELGRVMQPDANACILDYGCGIGRLAKGIIERYGCSVLGVDISPEMRALALDYVKSDRFAACSPEELERKVAAGFRAAGAYACWVLQHCASPREDIARIESALADGALFFVLNSHHRWVPTDRGWGADSIAVDALLEASFDVISRSGVSHLVGSEILARESYAMLVRRR